MAEKLTPQQEMAVKNRGGKLLVSAAAGSGKTKVLVDRLLTYLTDPVDPANLDEFLIITYTKAAASELRGKIASKLTERIAQDPGNIHLQKQMQRLFLTKISTVHGFCSDLLREYAYKLDIAADFRVADENECMELREQVLGDLLDKAYETAGKDPDFRCFVDSQGLGRDDRLVPEILMKVYDSARCHLDPQGWLEGCLRSVDTDGVEDVGKTLWGSFLMEDLRAYLEAQIRVLDRCAQAADAVEGFEKPAMNLRDTLFQLESLRDSETWDDVSQNRKIEYGRLTFPRKNADPELSDRIKAARNACKKGLEKKLHSFADPSGQVLEDLEQSAGAARGLIALVREFDKEFSQTKRGRRVLDFSDLEHKTLDLLVGRSRQNPTVASREIGARFREIMVDEYQDSNGVQDAIFTALTAGKNNCFMVGDVKQSIYQFRLADPGIFLEKYHSFVPAEGAKKGEGRKVLLSSNFRSGGEVIEAVNDVFGTCMSPRVGGLTYGDDEALHEGIPHNALPEPGVELHCIEVSEDLYAEEAAYVADQIHTMLRNGTLIRDGEGFRPVQADDIVILLRSPGSVGQRYQMALESLGIRCATGGGTDLLQTEEVSALRSFLQTIANPRQDIPLLSTLASPVFGFTADDLAAFRSGHKDVSVYDALLLSELPKARSFLEILRKLRHDARMYTLTQLLEECFALTRLDSIYAAMAGGEAKRANLQTFYQLAADFEAGSLRDLGEFLEHLDAMEEKGLITAASANAGCVTIMSIHKSKGLEFPVVFLCSLARQFNTESLKAQILCDKELGLGLSVADIRNRIRYPSVSKRAIAARMAVESLSEEMRVLYVAMTRARDRLIMTYASKSMENDLKDIAQRMDFDGGRLLCQDAVCPGDWVLLTAMGRMEAGELHALGGRPDHLRMAKFPWKILLTQAPRIEGGGIVEEKQLRSLPQDAESVLQQSLTFRYGHLPATQAPSKQTATGRKGRVKDEEAAEDTRPRSRVRAWREPSFLSHQVQGKAYGSAIHAAMQYVNYAACGSEDEVASEIHRLVEEGFLSEEQGQLVNSRKIARFFETDIGRKLRTGTDHLREFKFSILDDGSHYGQGLQGEQVLLQGVVDCALIEEDGITVLDFKTDFVTEDTVGEAVERYRPQLQTYAEALTRIYEMPVKESLLYFFKLDRFLKI